MHSYDLKGNLTCANATASDIWGEGCGVCKVCAALVLVFVGSSVEAVSAGLGTVVDFRASRIVVALSFVGHSFHTPLTATRSGRAVTLACVVFACSRPGSAAMGSPSFGLTCYHSVGALFGAFDSLSLTRRWHAHWAGVWPLDRIRLVG